jgi:CRP-like cAMP-binding protein
LGLPEPIRRELTAGGRSIKFADGQVIQNRGDEAKVFFVIVSGQVKLGQYDDRGEMQVLMMIGTGDSFGEMACLGNFARVADAEAVGETELLAISEEKLSEVLMSSPFTSREVMRVMSRQLQEAMDLLIVFRKLPAPLRLARSLVLMSEGRKSPVTLSIRHQELAELVGVSRMSVANTLKQLEDADFIRRGYGEIVVKDRDGLMAWMKAQH